MMSISPDLGQTPQVESDGIIQIAGQSPRVPGGSFAQTSTRPYFQRPSGQWRVVSRAEE